MKVLCCVVPPFHDVLQFSAIYHYAQKVVRCNFIRDCAEDLTDRGNGLQNETETPKGRKHLDQSCYGN